MIDLLVLSLNSAVFISILILWILLFVVFVGVGQVALRCWGFKIKSREELLNSFWVGWAHSIFFLQIWHLFWPVDGRAASLIFFVGGIGSISLARKFDGWRLKDRIEKVFCLMILCFGIWLSYHAALRGFANYDSGLYHLNSVRWDVTFPIVPGLGNLHGRLAFNSSYFLYVAMLQSAFSSYVSAYVANGVLLWVLSIHICVAWFKVFRLRDSGPWTLSTIFSALCIVPLFVLPTILENISSPSPDLPISILAMLLSINILAFVESVQSKDRQSLYRVFLLTLITALGIIIKLNLAIFGISTLVLVYGYLWSNKFLGDALFARSLKKIFCGFMIVISVWMVRGIILSGYLVYSFPWGSIPVDWRIPRASVVNMANWTSAWARQHQVFHWKEVLGNWDWIPVWLLRLSDNPQVILFPVALVVISGFFLVFFRSSRKKMALDKMSFFFFFPSMILSVVSWFLIAPETRFGAIFFWVLAIGFLTFNMHNANRPKIVLLIVVLSCLVFSKPEMAYILNGSKFLEFQKSSLVRVWSYLAKSDLQMRGPKDVALKLYVTRSGLFIYVPVEGDQSWDAPLPCSIYPHPDLRLRNPKSMRYGFCIEPKREDDASVGMHEEWIKEKWVKP